MKSGNPLPELGYDPKPEMRLWAGNPLAPVADPLPISPRRKEIAEKIYWQGPAWQILRNGVSFLRRLMDYGLLEDVRYCYRDIDHKLWLKTLRTATPGSISRQSFFFWSKVFGQNPEDSPHDWESRRMLADQKPRAHLTKADWYELAEREHFDFRS